MVFELNLYKPGHESYDIFSKEMQKCINRCKHHGDRLLEMAT